MSTIQTLQPLPVVVATDGRHESDSAVRLGQLIAGPAAAPRVEVDIRAGDPPVLLARIAREANASMILCGLGRDAAGTQPFHDETALRLVRRANAPVLAIAPDLDRAPRRIVVAMDFSETSVRAAQLAISLAGLGAVVHLVHVQPRDQEIRGRTRAAIFDLFDESSSTPESAFDPQVALGEIRDGLDLPPGLTVRRLVLSGDPATELLAFASGINADLVAAGANGLGFVNRMIVGRVASRVVRHSRRSVLIVPHASAELRAMSA